MKPCPVMEGNGTHAAVKSVVAFRREDEERPEMGAAVSKQLESVKHLLWHGNTEEALERLGDLLWDLQ